MDAAGQVGQILEAAQRAAEELRADAEARVRARIAEGDRAAGFRVEAAESEAAEIIATARAEAARLTAEAAGLRRSAEEERTRLVAEALERTQAETERVRAEAEAYAAELRTGAVEEARSTTADARSAARDVLEDGTALSADVRDLSSSLRANAERLLRDIKLAHATMTARLDQAPAGRSIESDPRPRRARAGALPADDELEVPEFIPGER